MKNIWDELFNKPVVYNKEDDPKYRAVKKYWESPEYYDIRLETYVKNLFRYGDKYRLVLRNLEIFKLFIKNTHADKKLITKKQIANKFNISEPRTTQIINVFLHKILQLPRKEE